MKSKKILVIDDDYVFLKVLGDGLKQKGKYTILTARDGDEGYSLAQAEKPDVILTDLMMPKVDGMNFIKKIRAHKDLQPIPIFVISQLSRSDKIVEAATLGVKGYIIKSDMSLDSIISMIESAVSGDTKI